VHDLEDELMRVSSLKQKEKIVTKVEKVELIPHDYEDL
jgi:hypothetical protein